MAPTVEPRWNEYGVFSWRPEVLWPDPGWLIQVE
ncbi:hypothetical protein SAMN05892883_2845 [Jatrophihabitans sp. GAS493]|nr:hypothetical protein SAMN05892883_2845 [Jatrophihabitans sp. GAS493]